MGVYIPNLKMPTDEPLLVKINPDGTVSTTARNNYKKYEAVELPPHGRLIDADELAKEIQTLQKYRFSIEDPEIFVSRGAVMQAISDNPTVIEAEEVGK